MTDNEIKRINELYHKGKEGTLTEEEKIEQKNLRAQYIADIKADLQGSLNNISIREADGTITPLRKKNSI